MIKHIEKSFENAENLISKLPKEVLEVDGMTGEMTRHFYNNLLEMQDARYLEIGCWAGSSSCSAMYNNKAHVVIIDDFSSFGGPREQFHINYNKYKGDNDATFIEHDCFTMDPNSFKHKFNIYLFDADHSEESQYRGLNHFLPAMEDEFIYIVDDANWKEVRDGTDRAIKSNGLEVVWKKEILLSTTNEFTYDQEVAEKTWWNGISVFILKKTKN